MGFDYSMGFYERKLEGFESYKDEFLEFCKFFVQRFEGPSLKLLERFRGTLWVEENASDHHFLSPNCCDPYTYKSNHFEKHTA